MSQRHLDHLSSDDCLSLLASRNVGRVVYVDEKGPVAIPVNYAMDRNRVVFRVEDPAKRFAVEQPVAFEVDQVDDRDHTAWSVLVRGHVRELPIEEVVHVLERIQAQFPRPWAEGIHNHWIALEPTEWTGRRLGDSVGTG
jgi:uncharacterized protein